MKLPKLTAPTAIVILAFLFISLIPLFDDPFYHQEKVCFWTWAYREAYELIYGEK